MRSVVLEVPAQKSKSVFMKMKKNIYRKENLKVKYWYEMIKTLVPMNS